MDDYPGQKNYIIHCKDTMGMEYISDEEEKAERMRLKI